MDMGSDNMSGFHWLLDKGVAATAVWDWSHGCSNDWKCTMRECGMMPFWTLMVVAFNAATGPVQDCLRWKQYGEAWDMMFSNFTPATSPLFNAHSRSILEDMGGWGKLGGAGTPEEQLWRYLKMRLLLAKVSVCT